MSLQPSLMENRVCIIIPTYNNEATLREVISEVLTICPDLLVVNDGSTDSTESILASFPDLDYISYPNNRGKGYALRKGFEHLFNLGYDYAVTLDSDGQHEPENISDLMEQIQLQETETVLMGSRNMAQDGIPKKSSFGNNFSNFWFWVDTGIKLSDTQTGFRAYPLAAIAKKRWFTKKFEFEIEVIVRLAWAGIPIKEVPVAVNYPEDRVSHFRPFTDFSRISVLNIVLLILALGYYAPKRLFFTKGEKNIFTQIKREFQKHQDDPTHMAGAVGLGLFFGVFPIWGFQMFAAFFVASLLKLNRVIVVTFSNISLPPMIPLIIISSYFFGGFFVKEKVLIPDFSDISVETIYLQIHQYLVGAVILSCLLGLLGFGFTYVFMKIREK
ncbi:DUF2062 domain-containing protein [Algoriphagus chordae]|uniref:Glycosyltransferase involved in cell wall biosynthesis n=1 Tax=Algoriphagus chordae TaxID=237019 RepID=A0A2W7RD91_9BACT|nr:DUF2062 domain-containing protein [Algoriphagus chordae]PZX48705.1 glycosyltransferase involved in cell wall biosynthesis [Algoriphagus chordae]